METPNYTLDMLPMEILSRITNYVIDEKRYCLDVLCRLRIVCSAFYNTAMDHQLGRLLRLVTDHDGNTTKILTYLREILSASKRKIEHDDEQYMTEYINTRLYNIGVDNDRIKINLQLYNSIHKYNILEFHIEDIKIAICNTSKSIYTIELNGYGCNSKAVYSTEKKDFNVTPGKFPMLPIYYELYTIVVDIINERDHIINIIENSRY